MPIPRWASPSHEQRAPGRQGEAFDDLTCQQATATTVESANIGMKTPLHHTGVSNTQGRASNCKGPFACTRAVTRAAFHSHARVAAVGVQLLHILAPRQESDEQHTQETTASVHGDSRHNVVHLHQPPPRCSHVIQQPTCGPVCMHDVPTGSGLGIQSLKHMIRASPSP